MRTLLLALGSIILLVGLSTVCFAQNQGDWYSEGEAIWSYNYMPMAYTEPLPGGLYSVTIMCSGVRGHVAAYEFRASDTDFFTFNRGQLLRTQADQALTVSFEMFVNDTERLVMFARSDTKLPGNQCSILFHRIDRRK
jgi:hypothetical protein